jgi:hypothetical protein
MESLLQEPLFIFIQFSHSGVKNVSIEKGTTKEQQSSVTCRTTVSSPFLTMEFLGTMKSLQFSSA